MEQTKKQPRIKKGKKWSEIAGSKVRIAALKYSCSPAEVLGNANFVNEYRNITNKTNNLLSLRGQIEWKNVIT